MGFALSVGILQRVQRKLAMEAGLDPSREVRPDRPLPDAENGEMWQIYIDNYDDFKIEKKSKAHVGLPSDSQQKMRWVKRKWGIPLAPDKSQESEETFAVLGATFRDGELGVGRPRRAQIMLAVIQVLASTEFSLGVLESLVGVLSHTFLFCRPLFSIFQQVYKHLKVFRGGQWLPAAVYQELFLSMLLLPLATCNLKALIDNKIFVSDASLWGGAFGYTSGSSTYVRNLLRNVDVRGVAVRLDGLEPLGRVVKPVVSFPCHEFEWRVLKSWKWKSDPHSNHMVLLEAQAFLISLRQYLSNPNNFGKRRIHIFDAFSALAAFAKGRSSSVRLNRLCRKALALQICSGVTSLFAWTDSKAMPMDEASRRFAPQQRWVRKAEPIISF